jgi:homoserine dehydrogenase
MMNLRVALLGFGNVGRALAGLLISKAGLLQAEHNLHISVTAISTRRHGLAIDPAGIDLPRALDRVIRGESLSALHRSDPVEAGEALIHALPTDLIFESIPTNPSDGEPALSYTRSALKRGLHVVTANKGPVAFGYRELSALASAQDCGFFFESTVMDGAPTMGIGRESLPVAHIHRISGIFNSTTNYILTRMEQDSINFDEAVRAAQSIGIAETDPSLDVDGWDASIKVVILANVLMGADLRPIDVDRQGIRTITLNDVQSAAAAGQRIRLLCEAVREGDIVRAVVKPSHIPIDQLPARIMGTSSLIEYETDVLPRLTLIENDPGPVTTAYGMLVDMINIARGRFKT